MMLVGKIEKTNTPFWYAECRPIGVFTQGRSASDAMEMLADAIEVKVGVAGFKVRVTTLTGTKDAYTVLVESEQDEILFGELLKSQRMLHKLTLSEVAKRLGSASHNSYAAYEAGKRSPSATKMREILAVVAPDMMMTIGPRIEAGGKKRKAAK